MVHSVPAIKTYAARMPVQALYLHVPFCRRRCHYCDFYSIAKPHAALVNEWHEAIALELKRLAYEAGANGVDLAPLKTIYYGGGTPSLIPSVYVAQQIQLCRELFGLAPDVEITLEANPESLLAEQDKPAIWREAGITRLSIGVQSSVEEALRLAGRIHTAEEAELAVAAARKANFAKISADLITGLPAFDLEGVEKTLEMFLRYKLGHISTYALEIAAGTVFAARQRAGFVFPDDVTERKLNDYVKNRLSAAGFGHYEISNYAQPGQQSEHNLVYWRADPYLAAGPSAAFYLAGLRRRQASSLEVWRQQVEGEGPYGRNLVEEIIDEEAARRETMWLGLRLLAGVDDAAFVRRHGVSYHDVFASEIDNLLTRGLLSEGTGNLRLTEGGLDLANQVFAEFVA